MKKTIYSPAYRKFIAELKQARINRKLRQEDVGNRIGRSRHWIQKVETLQIRIDVYQLVVLCRVYGEDPGRLIRRLEEEVSDEDPLFYVLIRCGFRTVVEPIQRQNGANEIVEKCAFLGGLICSFWTS